MFSFVKQIFIAGNYITITKNDSIVFSRENHSRLLPYIPSYEIDSINNILYFNDFKSSFVSYDLNQNKILNEVYFKENYNNIEKNCGIKFLNNFVAFFSDKNLILFNKSLDSAFNAPEQIVINKNGHELIKCVKFSKIQNDSIYMEYESEFNKGVFCKTRLEINLKPVDSLSLLNFPLPEVIKK